MHAWPGDRAHDEIEYLSGRVLARRFLRWHEGVGYDLEIGRRSGRTSKVSWRIAPLSDDRSTLAITVYPHVFQDLSPLLRWFPYRFRIRPMLETYLSSVIPGFDWYVTRGEPVPRNRFGTHPWFS